MKKEKSTIDGITQGKALVSLAFNKGHFLKFNEFIAKEYDVDTSIMVALMIDRENFFVTRMANYLEKFGGFFNYPTKTIQERIGMSRYRQRRTIDILEREGVLEVKKLSKKDIHERLYKINHKGLSEILLAGAIETIKKQEKEGRLLEDMEQECENILDGFDLLK